MFTIQLTDEDKAAAEEVRVGRVVGPFLRNLDFDVYQEVSFGRNRQRPDMVARRGRETWVVECKATCSLRVVAQAIYWLGRSNRVAIATPRSHRSLTGSICHILKAVGVGWLSVAFTETNASLTELQGSPFTRKTCVQWDRVLKEEQKTWCEAGSQGGIYSPFAVTRNSVLSTVKNSPGISLSNLILSLEGKHHYQSDDAARKAIPHWIRKGVIKGIRIFKEKGELRLYLESQCLDLGLK